MKLKEEYIDQNQHKPVK